MLKDLIKKSGMSKDDILFQIRNQFDRGHSYVRKIRQEFRKEDKLFINEKKKKEKLGDFTYYSTYTALMARSYVNKPESKFISTIGNKNIVDKLNYAIETDFNQTDMEVKKYYRDSDKFKRGVGILGKQGRDGYEKRNIITRFDPKLWIPDPDADYVSGEYSYSCHQDDLYKSDLENMEDREDINFDELSDKKEDDGAKYHKETEKRNNDLTYTDTRVNNNDKQYDVCYYFGYFNGVAAMVLLGNERKVILKALVYKAINNNEEEGKVKIPLPLAFTYYSPDGTPFGKRLPTFVADPQKAKAIMNNLRMDKEIAELYPMYLRNSRMIPNRKDLDFGFNKIVDVNTVEGEPLNNALTPISKDFRSDNSFLIEQSIDRGVAGTTSISKTQQGSLPTRRETAETNSIVQDNTDINLSFYEKIEAWGEKQLLRIILRGYQENFTDGDKKHIHVKTSYGLLDIALRKEDFLTTQRLEIQVKTNTEIRETEDKERVALGNAIGMIQTLPMTESGKKFLYREYFEKLGLSKEKAERIVDYDPDEIIAIANIELLNQGIYLEVSRDYDPMTHLTALKSAKPGLNVDLYRRGLLGLYKIKGMTKKSVGENMESVANNMAAQASSSLANEAVSLQSNNK